MSRTCGRCQTEPAENARGKPVCASCRAICTKCGGPRDARGYCPPCLREFGRKRPQRIKACVECGTVTASKSASNYCYRCQHERKKHPCRTCGVKIDGRAELCMPCWGAAHAGANATNYKNGRSKNKYHGYVILTGYKGHPRASANGGQVKEHVIVMEQVLGRYLLPHENVHHKNGVRDDNRIENLELWTKSQPAGQRAEDMVAWAKELLALYEPSALAQPVTPAA